MHRAARPWKLLAAGAPMLPLGMGSVSAGRLRRRQRRRHAGHADHADHAGATPRRSLSAELTGMAAPTLANPAAMSTTTVGSSPKVTMSDDISTKQDGYRLAYQPLFITGDEVSGRQRRQDLA